MQNYQIRQQFLRKNQENQRPDMKICPRTFFKKKDNEFRAITTWENQLMFVKINDLIQWVIGSV